jgi:hypothetical protein
MGKKSRTPSVETRVVETKQKFSGSLENILFTLFTFCLPYFHFLFFCSSSSSFVVFYYYFTPTYFPLVFGFFWPEGARLDAHVQLLTQLTRPGPERLHTAPATEAGRRRSLYFVHTRRVPYRASYEFTMEMNFRRQDPIPLFAKSFGL